MELANKFLQSGVVQIPDPKNMVAFKTLSGGKKATMLVVQPALLFISVLINSLI